MRRILISLFLFSGSMAVAQATKETLTSNVAARSVNQPAMILSSCPGNAPFLWHYQPKPVSALAELPPAVAANVQAYLLVRVGATFFNTLVFTSGQLVELTKDDSASLGVKDYQWKLATYYLRFNCQTLKEPDGSYFQAGASFDIHGSVVDSVNLPAFSKQRSNFALLTASQAVRIGRTNWHAAGGCGWINRKAILLSYSPLNQSLVWWFSKTTAEGPGKKRTRRIIIDATTGAVLRVRDNEIKTIPF